MPRRRSGSRGKRRRRFNFGKLAVRLLIVAAIVAVGWWFLGVGFTAVTGALAKTAVVAQGTVERVVAADAWIIPTIAETQVSPLTGLINLKVPEAERTRVGAVIAEILSDETQGALIQQLDTYERDLAALKERNAGERASANTRLQEVESQLTAKLAALRTATQKGNQSEVTRLQAETRQLGEEKATLQSKLASFDAAEAELTAKRDQASQAVSQSAYQMLAMVPGAVAYRFDGLEDVLTMDKVVAMGSRGLWDLRERVDTVKDKQQVQAGQPVFKIIDPSKTHLALAVKADEFAAAGQGKVTIRFTGLERATVAAELVTAGKPERNGYLVALYSTGDYLTQFGQLRRVSVEIVKSASNGMVVPESALVTRGGQIGVWEVRRGTARFVPVTVLCRNGSEAAVDGLTAGAEVVRSGRFIFREGQRVR